MKPFIARVRIQTSDQSSTVWEGKIPVSTSQASQANAEVLRHLEAVVVEWDPRIDPTFVVDGVDRADGAPAARATTESTQKVIVRIGAEVFGAANMVSRDERLKRFMEEAVELVRAAGLSSEAILKVVEYELGRPVGPDVNQELGGAGVTLYALADALGQDLDTQIVTEIRRVEANKDRCRAKHAAKPSSVKSGA